MASTQDEIAARVGLDSTAFSKGVRSLVKETKAAFSGLAGSLAVIFSGAGIAKILGDLTETAKRVKTVAQVTGASTDFIQGFERGLKKLGIEAEAADTALERFIRTVGEARQSGKRELGGVRLSNSDGTIKGTQQLILEFADHFRDIQDPAERARLAVELFGKGAAEAGVFLAKGSEGVQKFIDEAGKLSGGSIDALLTARGTIKEVFETITIWIGKAVSALSLFSYGLGFLSTRAAKTAPGLLSLLLGSGISPTNLASLVDAVKEAAADAEAESDRLDAEGKKQSAPVFGEESDEAMEKRIHKGFQKLRKELKQNETEAEKARRAQQTADERHLAYVQEEGKLKASIAETSADLANAKEDRSKFSLADLANTNANSVLPGARGDVRAAQRVARLEWIAQRQANIGNFTGSQATHNMADAIKQNIGLLKSGERDPFHDLKLRLDSQAIQMKDFLAREALRGINVVPVNGN